MNWILTEIDILGPVGPPLLVLAVLGVTQLVFSSFLFLIPQDLRQQDGSFLRHARAANMTFAGIAVVLGYIGTYWGLFTEVVPGLSDLSTDPAASGRMMSGLSTAFVTSIVGLAIGGILGPFNDWLMRFHLPAESPAVKATTKRRKTSRISKGQRRKGHRSIPMVLLGKLKTNTDGPEVTHEQL